MPKKAKKKSKNIWKKLGAIMSLDVYLKMKIDTGGKELYNIELYRANITHNLGKMANEVGIYKHLWRPEEIGIKTAGELIEPLEEGLELMGKNPKRFKKFDAPNKWGVYKDLLSFVENYLNACKEHPKANIIISR